MAELTLYGRNTHKRIATHPEVQKALRAKAQLIAKAAKQDLRSKRAHPWSRGYTRISGPHRVNIYDWGIDMIDTDPRKGSPAPYAIEGKKNVAASKGIQALLKAQLKAGAR
jgi:hypothetical protein